MGKKNKQSRKFRMSTYYKKLQAAKKSQQIVDRATNLPDVSEKPLIVETGDLTSTKKSSSLHPAPINRTETPETSRTSQHKVNIQFKNKTELELLIGRKIDDEELQDAAMQPTQVKRVKRLTHPRKVKKLNDPREDDLWKRPDLSDPKDSPKSAQPTEDTPHKPSLDDSGIGDVVDTSLNDPGTADVSQSLGRKRMLRASPAKRECFQIEWKKKKDAESTDETPLTEKNKVLKQIFKHVTTPEHTPPEVQSRAPNQSPMTSPRPLTFPGTPTSTFKSPPKTGKRLGRILMALQSQATPVRVTTCGRGTTDALRDLGEVQRDEVTTTTEVAMTTEPSMATEVFTATDVSTDAKQMITTNENSNLTKDSGPISCVEEVMGVVQGSAPKIRKVSKMRRPQDDTDDLVSAANSEESMNKSAGTRDKVDNPKPGTSSISTPNLPGEGRLVWAKLAQQPWWPALIIHNTRCGLEPARDGTQWVMWFGDRKVSMIAHKKCMPFADHYADNVKGCHTPLYKKAIKEVLEECARRLVYDNFNLDEPKDQLHVLMAWAGAGFRVRGESKMDGLQPSQDKPLPQWAYSRAADLREMNSRKINVFCPEAEEEDARPLRIERINPTGRFTWVRAGKLAIEEVCLACEGGEVVMQHPYFRGGLCQECKDDTMESMFVFGEDGLNMYCVICANAGELFVCDSPECQRVYCTGCITALVAMDTVAEVRADDAWRCFLCDGRSHGLLDAKADWRNNVLRMFSPTTQAELTLLPGDAPKRPIRVLSLFDGISTGKLVLDMLGVEVEAYFASEIDPDALMVSRVRHMDSITHIGDVTSVDMERLKEICPIDLVIGGSPCNELSLCNPARKGLEGGSGQLFFEFYRVLSQVRELSNRHVFWLYENVASMPKDTKATISRFFGCEPVLWDAKHFTAQKRKRYFWGNIPAMYCPHQVFRTQQDENLSDSLMGKRKGAVSKIRCVTTRTNSLMQGSKDAIFPVRMGDYGDTLWIPELESVFGFPPHYTDVADLPSTRRQKLIGKAWSLPVIKHLLASLKQFFVLANNQ